MRIGTLSKRTGVSRRMLRYYEEEGLLRPVRRPSGYRDYRTRDETIVRQIRRLGAAGLTLPVIRRFLPCLSGDRPDFEPCDDLRATLEREIDLLDARIAGLSESRRMLAGFLCSTAAPPDASSRD